MFEQARVGTWYGKYIIPAMRRAVAVVGHQNMQPYVPMFVTLWLWAVLFRFHGQFAVLSDASKVKSTEIAFNFVIDTYFDIFVDADDRRQLMEAGQLEGVSPGESIKRARMFFRDRFGAFYMHAIEEASRLVPLHQSFDTLAFYRAYEAFRPTLVANGNTTLDNTDLQRLTVVAAQAQAMLYFGLTGIGIAADQIPTNLDDVDPCDVFISYSRADGVKAHIACATLKRHFGLNAWMDEGLVGAERFDLKLNAKIRSAQAVLVLWSSSSIASRWVHAEAAFGFEKNRLVPMMIERCDVPIPFNLVQAFDFTDWTGEETHREWQPLVAALGCD